jgi:uncharacterized protein YdeI (YjbR/CyaY-like superfamily)
MKTPGLYLEFASHDDWRAWLEAHHADAREAWVLHFRKGLREGVLTYEEALDEALCFGWIDGLLKKLDADRFLLRYSPRRRRSIWSEGNKQRAERLVREGRMAPAGLARIAEAKGNGEWEAATQRENVDILPPDLEAALHVDDKAFAAFQEWPDSRKKQYLWWISSAKRAETRERRIRAVVEMVAKEAP